MNPKANAIHARTSRPRPTIRLSTPTYTMLSAMAGSMIRAGGVTTFSAASDSVMLCATVKALTISSSRRIGPPSSNSPMRNSNVVGADQDVVDSGGHELAHHCQHALASAHEIFELADGCDRESPGR